MTARETLADLYEHAFMAGVLDERGELEKRDHNVEAAQQARAKLEQDLVGLKPGTGIYDWKDFKSKEEEHEYIGYCKAVKDYENAIRNYVRGE